MNEDKCLLFVCICKIMFCLVIAKSLDSGSTNCVIFCLTPPLVTYLKLFMFPSFISRAISYLLFCSHVLLYLFYIRSIYIIFTRMRSFYKYIHHHGLLLLFIFAHYAPTLAELTPAMGPEVVEDLLFLTRTPFLYVTAVSFPGRPSMPLPFCWPRVH